MYVLLQDHRLPSCTRENPHQPGQQTSGRAQCREVTHPVVSFPWFPETNTPPFLLANNLFPVAVAQFKGIPSEVEVDMSKPEEGRMSKAGQVLVDLATKRAY